VEGEVGARARRLGYRVVWSVPHGSIIGPSSSELEGGSPSRGGYACRMFSTIGLPEILIVLLIVLVIFGPKRLPALGRQLGKGMREFKGAIERKADDDEDEGRERPTATPALGPTATPAERPASPAPRQPADRR
jgi:sec-independent protein translocase protein TatA